MRWRSLAILLAVWIAPAGDGRCDEQTWRVGTSGDYRPFSFRDEGGSPAGLDIELIERFAEAQGAAIELVPFVWRELLDDMHAGRFDVVVGGITIRPERSVAGVFSVPVLATGAVLLLTGETRDPSALPGFRLGVNRGGHLERVARARFPRAQLATFENNAAVPRALARGAVDGVLTDTVEAPHWQRIVPSARVLGPITRDRKAWWFPAHLAERAAAADRWLLDLEANGELGRARAEALGHAGSQATAHPLDALLAAVHERLSLMVHVADAKRQRGLPIDAPGRERAVLEGAVRAAREEPGAPPDAMLRRLFTELFAAAKEVQRVRLEEPATSPAFDLERELRPALSRISARVARIAAAVHRAADSTRDVDIAKRVEEELLVPGLSSASRRAMAGAIEALTLPQSSPISARMRSRSASRAGADGRSGGSS